MAFKCPPEVYRELQRARGELDRTRMEIKQCEESIERFRELGYAESARIYEALLEDLRRAEKRYEEQIKELEARCFVG